MSAAEDHSQVSPHLWRK